jgi:hypothetical protein
LLLAALRTNAQEFANNGQAVIQANPDHSAFYAYAKDNIVIMRWGTGNESEVDHYVTEHSTDSVHFDPMHQVVAKGTIDVDSTYEDADAWPGAAVNFYRLTTVNKDGSATSSPAVRIEVDPGKTPVLVPTVLHPGESTMRIDNNYRNDLLIVEFFSAGGHLMKSYEVNSSSFMVNTTGWANGIYYYRITDQGHPLVDSGKILVQ